jgi:hypothetical protein
MAKKRSGPGDEDADFSAFDKIDDILRLDDAALNDVFAWLDDCSALDDTLRTWWVSRSAPAQIS